MKKKLRFRYEAESPNPLSPLLPSVRTTKFARGILAQPDEKPPSANAGKCAYGDRLRKSEFVVFVIGEQGA
ncbi:MAG: hypothetical protein OXG62_03045 [Nitrospinae bacterium]|nr:hypothetical protein [Nitrospinota bacterium]